MQCYFGSAFRSNDLSGGCNFGTACGARSGSPVAPFEAGPNLITDFFTPMYLCSVCRYHRCPPLALEDPWDWVMASGRPPRPVKGMHQPPCAWWVCFVQGSIPTAAWLSVLYLAASGSLALCALWPLNKSISVRVRATCLRFMRLSHTDEDEKVACLVMTL